MRIDHEIKISQRDDCDGSLPFRLELNVNQSIVSRSNEPVAEIELVLIFIFRINHQAELHRLGLDGRKASTERFA